MTDSLVYGKFYWKELKRQHYAPDSLESKEIASPHWQSKSEDFLEQVRRGDSLWVIIPGEQGHQDEWRLLQRIVLDDDPTHDAELKDSEYGPYSIRGDPRKSKVFRVLGQPDFKAVLKMLKFKSNKPIRARGRQIGNLIEGIRPLAHSDIILLEEYTKTLEPL
jgi:hypothetical protein